MMAKGNENLSFTHPRLRRIFTVSYSLHLLLNEDNLSKISWKEKQESENVNIEADTIGVPWERSDSMSIKAPLIDIRSKGLTLIKPLFLQFLGALYLKADKQVAEEFILHLGGFVEFLNNEIKRLEKLPDDFKPTEEFSEYIFDILIPLLSNYVNKLIIDNIDEGRERRDNDAIQDYLHTLCVKFFTINSFLTKDQAEVFRKLLEHYYDDHNMHQTKVMEKLDDMRRKNVKERLIYLTKL